jgi:ubiquitin C-terminal hydrolase
MNGRQCQGICGLVNFGNTCYLNSIIQTLNSSELFTKEVLSENFLKNVKIKDGLSLEIEKLLKGIWNDNCIIVPESLVRKLTMLLRIPINYQHDVDEFLEKILNKISEELCMELNIKIEGNIRNEIEKIYLESLKSWEISFKKEYSFITELFYGQYFSEIICLNCNHKVCSYDPFMILELELKYNNILDCIKKHTSFEEDIEDYKCDKCNKKHIKKRLNIIRLPKILLITLKRYNNNICKISNDININNNLKLKTYLGHEMNYDLKSIIMHEGSCMGGHYYTYTKSIRTKKWFNFNDENVSEIEDINKINKKNIYCLLYEI